MNSLPDPLPIAPVEGAFDLVAAPPGSKSITNRAYVLAALAEGESRIARPLRADDTDGLLRALGVLGAEAAWDGEDVVVRGVAGRFPRGGRVDLGDGGTPTRFMIAAACLASAPVDVDGSPRMRERPVAEGIEMLRALGARIEYLDGEGRLPVRISPGPGLGRGGGRGGGGGGELTVGATASSQFVSALMLIAPWLSQPLALRFTAPPTSASYVRMTDAVLRDWGAPPAVEIDPASGDLRRLVIAPHPLRGRVYAVEPDASSAAYWLAAAALVPGAAVRIAGLPADSVQPDARFGAVLERMGASASPGREIGLRYGGPLRGLDADLAEMPDAAVCLAAVASAAHGPSTIRGLRTLRVKETDRIAALACELRRIGCTVATADDAITVDPAGGHHAPVTVTTYNDHRIGMAFAVLGLVRPGISIADPGCVAKSYPTFFEDFANLYSCPSD